MLWQLTDFDSFCLSLSVKTLPRSRSTVIGCFFLFFCNLLHFRAVLYMKHLSMHHIDAVVHRKVLVQFPVFGGKLCAFPIIPVVVEMIQ